ncbi:MAG: helix-turn-helix domain-containing protein [Nitrospirae bacterium]|nr:helix-turn-helix domain-containing protein [Nitrospirota bacterium]
MTEFATYVEGIKVKLGIKSDRELALKLGIAPPSLCNIVNGHGIPSDDTCLKIAALAGDDPEQVLLLAHKSKASEKSKPYWDSLLKKVAAMSLLFAIAFPLCMTTTMSATRYIM